MADSTCADNQPLRILIFGAADILMRPIIKRIKSQLPQSSKLLVVGNKHDIGLTNLVRMERRPGTMEKLLKSDKFSSNALELMSDRSLKLSLMTGLDHLERKSKNFVWRHHKLDRVSESVHYYHIAADLIAGYLAEQQINFVLFFDIPHLFTDTLCYQIAKSKGIETLIVNPSSYADHFYSLRNIEDYGLLHQNVIDGRSNDPHVIGSEETTEWLYMKEVKQYRGELGSLNWLGILNLIAHLLAVQPSNLIRINLLLQTINRMRLISSALPKWRYPFKNYFCIQHLDYYETLIEFENSLIDLECKFVYFPLHYQPEMTTSALGGEYSDQLLAIEKLSQILADDYSIFVKENPMQGGQMRGTQFFRRLTQISNVHWLPSYANTHELIDKCQFVATVTGTAGWEAIQKGKKVLVFGIPWYRNLSGVIPFREELKLEEIINYEINFAELETQVGSLNSRTHAGNISPLKRRHTSGGYNLELNAELVANTLVQLIENRMETTFISS